MRIGLGHKIILTNLIVLIITFLIVSLVLIEGVDRINRNMLVQSLVNQSEISVRTIKQSLLTDLSSQNLENEFNTRARDFSSKLSKESGLRVVMVSSSKTLLADSESIEPTNIELDELNEAFNDNGNRAYSVKEIDGTPHLVFAFPVMYSGKIIGGVVFIQTLESVNSNKKNIGILLLIAFVIGTIVILTISIFISLKISSPIAKLRESAIRISQGYYENKIEIKSNDEVGALAGAFNVMSDEINNRINTINYEKGKLNSVLESMGEGVLAYNCNNEIIAYNTASKIILSDFEDCQIINIADKTRKQNKKYVFEISKGDRSILVCATPLKLESEIDGVVLILNDISELRNLQEKQKQFVSNVSHELKTPLTTILGYVDLLKERGDDKKIFETSITHLESSGERLLRLVEDLVDLSSFSRYEFKVEKRNNDLASLVRETVGQMSLKAQKFNIPILMNIESVGEIPIDQIRIKQAIVNIIDNAIKYSQKGIISVRLFEVKNKVHLEVEDNGCGIPKDLVDKIFEPFYRVDKARARDIGGNGLGLSITKEIVEKHDGQIILDSIEGIGTKVSIILLKE